MFKCFKTFPFLLPLCFIAVIKPCYSLTLQDALKHAYVHNPSLNAARAELRSIYEQYPQALSGWKPTIQGEASLIGSDIEADLFNTGGTEKSYTASISQPIFQGGSTFAKRQEAQHLIRAQTALLLAIEQQLFLDAGTIYMDVLRNRAILQLSKNNYRLVHKQYEEVSERFLLGDVTRTDLSQTEASLAQAEADIINSQAALKSSEAEFENIIGLKCKGLSAPKTKLKLPDNIENAIDIALKQNPEILAAEQFEKSSSKNVYDVFGELLPQIFLNGSVLKTEGTAGLFSSDQTSQFVSLDATIPLYKGGNVRSRMREAKEIKNQRFLEITKTKNDIHSQTVTNWHGWKASQAEIIARHAQVKASRVAQEGVKSEAILGGRTILDILDAHQSLLDSQVALVTAERDEMIAQFVLASSLGILHPLELGFGSATIDVYGDFDEVRDYIFNINVDSVDKAK